METELLQTRNIFTNQQRMRMNFLNYDFGHSREEKKTTYKFIYLEPVHSENNSVYDEFYNEFFFRIIRFYNF